MPRLSSTDSKGGRRLASFLGKGRDGRYFILFCFIFFVFCLVRATPAAYGGSQARGPIRAAAAGLRQSHSNADLSSICDLHHSSWQRWILTPLIKARDRTRNLMSFHILDDILSSKNSLILVKSIFIHLFIPFCLFRAAPTAYRGSQARGPIRAIAAGLHHSYSN